MSSIQLFCSLLPLGCVLDNRLNGVHLDLKGSSHVTVVRRNVVGGCPCSEGECMHNSTCQINPAILYLYVCNCSLGYTGHRCDSSIPPGRGKTERKCFARFNPLTPNNDVSQTSHCNIKGVSVSEVMRIENMITQVQFY